MSFHLEEFRGYPAVRLALPDGASCVMALHGAHVLSWTTADGVERLYLSPTALFDGHSALRGGVPVCWPQFNQRGPLAKHGFARNMAWESVSGEPDATGISASTHPVQCATFSLHDTAATRLAWPHKFSLHLTVTLEPAQLTVTLQVDNTDSTPWTFAAALHTYLRVEDIAEVCLDGLCGAHRWDAVKDVRQVEIADPVRFDSEFDSVYAAPAQPLRLIQPSGTLQISQSESCSETVVWNPGAALGAKLVDLPDEDYRQMLCVEAARIDENVMLAPGAQWQAWQRLRVL